MRLMALLTMCVYVNSENFSLNLYSVISIHNKIYTYPVRNGHIVHFVWVCITMINTFKYIVNLTNDFTDYLGKFRLSGSPGGI